MPVISNVKLSPLGRGVSIRHSVSQVTAPVRWQESVSFEAPWSEWLSGWDREKYSLGLMWIDRHVKVIELSAS